MTEVVANGKRSVRQVGLRREIIGDGPERLLRALLQRGLSVDSVAAAAALAFVLDEELRRSTEGGHDADATSAEGRAA